MLSFQGCDLIRMKGQTDAATETGQVAVARVNKSYLYKDDLAGIVPPGTPSEDSAARVQAYVNSWIRKQLLMQEALKKININEAELERKIMDYRYSLIAYEYQAYYIRQHLDTAISNADIEKYYRDHPDNFILKQNIVRATFIKVPKTAPRTNKIKDLILSRKEKDRDELKSYCLSFSAAYHLSDSSWMVFDELVKNTPLAEIPNKVQFLRNYNYYETTDENYLYFLKVDEYRISDNISPIEFVRDEIKNILLNKRKVELVRKLEDEIYTEAQRNEEFEVLIKQ
ncbi:MAG: peptidyl-prolyl cis-trans isomerase [Cyclobacteriaceae bacterium]|nr:peptidyl-prolyl cis-trans isomerase [Cyclobacteriaceae bacterium]